MKRAITERPTLAKGTRVELHPATSEWMRGDRYGEIIGYGKARQYVEGERGEEKVYSYRIPLRIKLDKSGRTIRQLESQISGVIS